MPRAKATAEDKPDIRARLESLSKDKDARNEQLLKLHAQTEILLTQALERERRITVASESKRQKTLEMSEPPNGPSRKFYEALERLSVMPPVTR